MSCNITLNEFMSKLPCHYKTGKPLYTNMGIIEKTYNFKVPVHDTPAYI